MSQIPYINIPKVDPNRSYPYLNFERISDKVYYEYLKQAEFNEYLRPEQITLPVRSTMYSAGYDFISPITVDIKPGETKVIGSGIKCKIDIPGIFLSLHARSSMSILKNISIGAGGSSIIDADYYNNENNEGHILLPLKNNGSKTVTINMGDKIVQGIFTNYYIIDNDKPLRLKRTGGVGSTGR